jgi:hypothetical protein
MMPDEIKEPKHRHVASSDVVRLTVHEEPHIDIKQGRTNLRRARSFLKRVAAEQERDPFDPEAAEDFLTAAIVFGKAVQDWMAYKYGGEGKAGKRGGENKKDEKCWLKDSPLWGDPLAEFFANSRNVIVHRDGSVDVTTRTSATAHVLPGFVVASRNPVIASVIPTNPTPEERRAAEEQRRRDEERVAQLRREEEERVRQIFAEHRAEQERQARAHAEASHRTVLHFTHTDPAISGSSAIDVVEQYLDLLERVLDEIETTVGGQ